MSTELTKGLKNINFTSTPETPYLKAQQVWDARIGSNVIQAKNWRLLSFSLITIIAFLLIGFIVLANKVEHIPYIVEVSNGEIKSINKAKSQDYLPNEAQLKYHLIKFVEKIRSVSIDSAVNKKWIFEAYAMLTPKTANKFDEYFSDSKNHIKFEDKQTVFVIVNSFTNVTKNTYQLQWQEELYDKNGKLLETTKWVAFATIQIAAPTSEQSILQNPLGIWITDFSWSKARE